MKKRALRTLALGLAAALALTPLASASQALGTEIHTVTLPLGEGVEMTKQHLWSATYSDLRTEHFMTYTPSEDIYPAVAYGGKITTRATLTDMAKTLEAQGKRVLGGVNGDYYVLATGAPLGMVVTGGVLRSTPQYTDSWSLGFLADGTAFISQPELSVTANFLGHTLAVSGGINKVRTAAGGYYLLTEEFGESTMNTSAGVDVILRPLEEGLGETVEVDLKVTRTTEETPVTGEAPAGEDDGIAVDSGDLDSGDVAPDPDEEIPERVTATLTRSAELKIGSRVTCEVVQVLRSEGKIEIPQGCYVLTINKASNAWLVEQLAALAAGDRVEIDIVGRDTRWNEAVTGIGGMYKLVTSGVVNEGLDTERAPRSAVGVRPDGSAVFYTIDGRQPGYSVGATLTQVAQRLVELGCVEAVCLDGGGSTTFGATLPDGESLTVANKPSDGSQRANSNALFLVSEKEPTGDLERLHVTPYDTILLAGAAVQMGASGIDSNGFPMEWAGSTEWSASGGGRIDEDGLFTAGSESGVTTITAETRRGTVTGSASITVVRTPDSIKVTDQATGAAVTALNLEPNQTVDLTASAVYRNLALGSQDENYIWTLDPAAGTVDQNGVLTAAAVSGRGYLTVSAGERSAIIPVTVTGHILPLENFEGEITSLSSTDTATVEKETDLEKVRFGRGSARVAYDAAGGAAALDSSLSIQAGERFLTLWVWGDGSGNTLMATVADGEGTASDLSLGLLDFTGWKRVTVTLPEGTRAIRELAVIQGGGTAAGTIWLDQMTTANEALIDSTAPVITMEVTTAGLTATVTDDLDKDLPQGNITVTLDGGAIPFTWDGAGAKVTAALPVEDGKLHRITVTAADGSGNLARASAGYSGGQGEWVEPFEDMEGHWAQGFTAYLYQQGITNGVTTETGVAFQPEKAISRGEFALMVARWQGLDLNGYAEVELPFADLADIPEWMLPAVRAMYAEGVMKGSLEGETLYANALKGISRVEVMTILGRLQSKGYAADELTFDDAGEVPAWALDHVKTLVTQGVVGGYENKVKPTDLVKRSEVAKMLVSLT